MGRATISEEKRAKVRDLHDRFPGMTYREIGARAGVNQGSVWVILNPRKEAKRKPGAPAAAPEKVAFVPPITVQQPGSIIRPVSMARLMAGR